MSSRPRLASVWPTQNESSNGSAAAESVALDNCNVQSLPSSGYSGSDPRCASANDEYVRVQTQARTRVHPLLPFCS